jgi:vitamin K-dependent gamma-carboxylase-like protein
VNPLRAWNAFWFGPIWARPLGLFRVAFGLIVLLNLALLSVELDYWFTDAGLLKGTESLEAAGYLRPSLLHYVRDPASVRIFFAAVAGVTLLFTVGWHTRVMGFLLYLGMLSIHHRNIAATNGADVLVMVTTFYMMLCPAGAACSLDARRKARKRGTQAEPLIVPWSQRLIQIQLTLVYLNTALLKAGGSSWQNGTALHYVLSNEEVRRFSLGLTQYPLLINVLTYMALMMEFLIPFCIWFRAARPWAIAAGVALHGGIFVTVNIPIFGELMMATYLLFLTPEELQALGRWFSPKHWRKSMSAPEAVPPETTLDAPDADEQYHALHGPHWGFPVEPDYEFEPAAQRVFATASANTIEAAPRRQSDERA